MEPPAPIYLSDPSAASDSGFVRGELRHLVPGNSGRMLDTRRTPIAVRGVDCEVGTFEVEVLAFEDAGARWTIDAERVGAFQFPSDAAQAGASALRQLAAACERFDRPLRIPVDPAARSRTRARLDAEERLARVAVSTEPAVDLGGRLGETSVQADLQTYLDRRGLLDMETAFASQFASNPSSGELVKGHEIVLASLGLVPYRGKAVRNPNLFDGAWSEERRADHILARLGFVRALFRSQGYEQVWLWRGIASDRPLSVGVARTFVSATFDPAVAEEIARPGPHTVVSVVMRQFVTVDRLFMTFVETAELNGVYREAEAVLLARPRNRAF